MSSRMSGAAKSFPPGARDAEALAELDRARELDPTSSMVSDQRGFVLYMERRNDEAIDQFRKSIELDPRFAHSHCWLGKAYLQKGMLPEGIAELQEATSLPGGDSPAYATLARICLRLVWEAGRSV